MGAIIFAGTFFGTSFFDAISFLFNDYFLVGLLFGGDKSNLGLLLGTTFGAHFLWRLLFCGTAFFGAITFLGEYFLEHEIYLQEFSSRAPDKK